MNKRSISIIMAVYNAENSLRRAIESLQAQTFHDWELIAVNDGSIDLSLTILKEYEAKDRRIHVIDKPNGGVASARQVGMNKMNGKYFIHADSDDWVEPTMLEEMLNKAIEDNADLVIADYFVEHGNGTHELIRQKPTSFESSDVLYAIYAKDLFGGLCHKLIKRSAYDKVDAHFIVGIDFCEDVLLLTQILSNQDLRISYINRAYYHYCLSDRSLTQKISSKGFESLKKFTWLLPDILPKGEKYKGIIEKSRLDLFVAGFMNNMYDSAVLRTEYRKVRDLALSTTSVRWKLGYHCIDIGWEWLAHKLIRF